MRPTRLAVALAAAAVLCPLAAAPALGAATNTAAGGATSSATLVRISAAGHDLAVGTLSAVAQTVTSAVPSVRFTPVDLDGTRTGTVTVTPSNSPKTVGGVTSSGVPAAVLSATSPTATLHASQPASGPTSGLQARLGSASVLGIPLTLDGGVDAGSTTTATRSGAQKSFAIRQLALPSIAGLLAALGVDLGALPVDTLNALLTELPLALSDATMAAVDDANGAIDDAQQAASDANGTVDDKQAAADAAETAYDAAAAAFQAALTDAGVAADDWAGFDAVEKAPYPAVVTAEETLDDKQQALADAQDELDTAQDDLDAAIADLVTAVGELVDLVEGVLDDTPIAEIGSANVATKAAVGAKSKVATVTGTVSGLKVLGQDVLDTVFGSSTLDVADIAGTGVGTVASTIAAATSALSTVLSEATGATGLVVPAPVVSVLKKTTKTGVDGAFGTADAGVTVLEVSFGSLTVPTEFALPGAGALPGVTETASGIRTEPLTMAVGVLAESARFRPGTAGPGTGTGTGPGTDMPSTGAPAGLALLAALVTAGAFGLRRTARSAG